MHSVWFKAKVHKHAWIQTHLTWDPTPPPWSRERRRRLWRKRSRWWPPPQPSRSLRPPPPPPRWLSLVATRPPPRQAQRWSSSWLLLLLPPKKPANNRFEIKRGKNERKFIDRCFRAPSFGNWNAEPYCDSVFKGSFLDWRSKCSHCGSAKFANRIKNRLCSKGLRRDLIKFWNFDRVLKLKSSKHDSKFFKKLSQIWGSRREHWEKIIKKRSGIPKLCLAG